MKMVYVNAYEVREVASIDSEMMSDNELAGTIRWACREFNNDVQILVEKEKIVPIDDVRTNEIDGTNKTFYTRFKYIGDLNYDFEVNDSDVIVWKEANNTKTYLTVASVNAKEGSFTLTTAPTSEGEYFVNYVYSKGLLDTLDPNMHLAALQNCVAWVFSKLNVGKAPMFKMDQLTIHRDTKAHTYWKSQYINTLGKIHAEWMALFSDRVNDKISRENEYHYM
jgi:hypothetical protein